MVIWTKTDAGRREIQARERVKGRAQRTLLLLIDGVKTDAALLASVAGIAAADFEALHQLGLVAPVGGAPNASPGAAPAAIARTASVLPSPGTPARPGPQRVARDDTAVPAEAADAADDFAATTPPNVPASAVDHRALTAALTQLIPAHLGVRGFTLTLAVEKAATFNELRQVAERSIEAISRRRGDAVAADVRRTLFGR